MQGVAKGRIKRYSRCRYGVKMTLISKLIWAVPAALALVAACLAPLPSHGDGIVTGTVLSRDGVPVVYDSMGSGRPLVLIHGWSCDRSFWDDQRKAFGDDFRVIALDLGGHGASGQNRQAWPITAFGEDVATVVTALDLRDVILVGHSMGGDAAISAAQILDDRLSGVVMVDTYKSFALPRTAEQVEQAVAPFRADFGATTRTFVEGMFTSHIDRKIVERVVTTMASRPPHIAVSAIEGSLAYGRTITEQIRRVKVPVVAINADDAPTDIASLSGSGVEVVVVPHTGHFLMMEDPPRFNAVLRQVIAENFPS